MSNRIRKGDRVVVHDDGPPESQGDFPFKAGEHHMVSDVNGINHDSVQIEGDERYWNVARFDLVQRAIAADRDNNPIFAGDRVFRVSKVGYPQFEAEALSSPDVGPRKRTKVRRLDTGDEFAVAREHLILVRHHWEPEDRMVKAMRELRAAWETHQDMQRTQVAVVAEFLTRAVLASVGETEGRAVEVVIPATSWEVTSNHALGSARDVAAPVRSNWEEVKPGDDVEMSHREQENTHTAGKVAGLGIRHGKRNVNLRGIGGPFAEADWEITKLIVTKPQPPAVGGTVIIAEVAKLEAPGTGELHLMVGGWTSPHTGNVYPLSDVVNHGFTVARDPRKDAS